MSYLSQFSFHIVLINAFLPISSAAKCQHLWECWPLKELWIYMKKHGMPILTAELVSAWGGTLDSPFIAFWGQREKVGEGIRKDAASREAIPALKSWFSVLWALCVVRKSKIQCWGVKRTALVWCAANEWFSFIREKKTDQEISVSLPKGIAV